MPSRHLPDAASRRYPSGVPKIDARTVAEHHDLHHAKLLDVALELVADHPVESLTLAGLAKRAGRSRASTYAYFASAEDLRAQVCEQVLGAWVAGVLDEVRQASLPEDRLDRFIAAQIDQRVEPSVDRVLAFVQSQQSEPLQARIRLVVEPLTAELLVIIGRLGVEPPTRAATVVQGAVAAAYDQVRAGEPARQVADDTIAFVRAGLAALRGADASDGRRRDGTAQATRRAGSGALSSAPNGPGALAMSAAPSMPSLLAAAVVAGADPTPLPVLSTPLRLRATTIAAAQLAWAVAAFATGALGVGGAGVHVLLGLSLVLILAWSVRALGSAVLGSAVLGSGLLGSGLLAPRGLRALLALSVASSAAALVARSQQVDIAVVTHVVLAAVLIVGLSVLTRAVWRSQRAMTVATRGL